MAAVAITRMELDASGLRRAAAREGDAAAVRRTLALALVLEDAGVARVPRPRTPRRSPRREVDGHAGDGA
jgi:hypothetical protein